MKTPTFTARAPGVRLAGSQSSTDADQLLKSVKKQLRNLGGFPKQAQDAAKAVTKEHRAAQRENKTPSPLTGADAVRADAATFVAQSVLKRS
jgi:hypothetical protein